MEKNLATSLLLLVSFIVITLGGYQCATNVTDLGPEKLQIPISPLPADAQAGEKALNSEEEGSLPSEPERSCTRSKYSEIEDKYGAKGFLKIDNTGAFDDFVLGETSNYDVRCPRMYLGMRAHKDRSRTYRGNLVISYEADGYIQAPVFSSGSSEDDNQYNKWTRGSWTEDSRNRVSRDFNAIFQNSKRAVILQMDDVRVFDDEDGRDVHYGAGKIYFKMFRLWTGDKSDVCYDKGTYVSQARYAPSTPNKRCWLIGAGPYSCLPNGVLSNPRSAVSRINITGSLDCYQLLGTFGRLNIKEAFNVSDVEELR